MSEQQVVQETEPCQARPQSSQQKQNISEPMSEQQVIQKTEPAKPENSQKSDGSGPARPKSSQQNGDSGQIRPKSSQQNGDSGPNRPKSSQQNRNTGSAKSKSSQEEKTSKLARPPPPVVGKVTHFSIEMYWDEAYDKALRESDPGDGRIRVTLQEHDSMQEWGNLYSGYAKRHVVSGLESQTDYKYRLRFANSKGTSEWSAHANVSTTKEPLNGEHLHKAIIRRDLDQLQKVLETGDVNVDVFDKYGFSGLMQASQKGYLDVVEVLLRYDADVHVKNDAGKTALMLACYAGQLEVVKILREHGARYEDFDRGGSAPIHWAVDGCNVKLIEWMIADGADVNLKDKNSHWTPLLRCACVVGNRDVGLTLLMNGGEIDAQDKDGKTALMMAIINGHQALVDLLLRRNANLNVKTHDSGKTAYEMAISMEKRRIIKTMNDYFESKGIKIY